MKRGREEEELTDIGKSPREDGNVSHVQDVIESDSTFDFSDDSEMDRQDVYFDVHDMETYYSACEDGNMAYVQEFIKCEGDMRVGQTYGRSGLQMAAGSGHVDIVKVLIENGANVNILDFEDFSTVLYRAAYTGHADIAKLLIQNGAHVNATMRYRETALHYAAEEGHCDVAKVLLQNGADVNAVDCYKRTALHRAAARAANKHALILELICFGAEIDKKYEKIHLLGEIKNRMDLLRAGKRIGTSLLSNEERHFMWNLAFSFTIKYRAAAFKAYYTIRSFITYHGIFMAGGYDLGEESVWKRGIGKSSE